MTVASNRLFDLTADSLKDVISGAESMEWEVSQGKGEHFIFMFGLERYVQHLQQL